MKISSLNRTQLIIALIYLVILAGGLVRMTGSGMGCPDWPKCFGQYIPPTDLSQLPEDYKTRFAVQGKEIADFNVWHTWIEYINRLLGAILGLVILYHFVAAFLTIKENLRHFLLSAALLVGVLFQAWLGAVVVSTDLAPARVTVHMLMALLLIILALAARSSLLPQSNGKRLVSIPRVILFFCAALTVVQILLGTQVREQIDTIQKNLPELSRNEWIDHLSMIFKVHRSFSILLILVNGAVIYFAIKADFKAPKTIHRGIIAVLLITLGSGVVMAWFGVPAWAQPVHLLLATVLFGLQVAWLEHYQRYRPSIATKQ